MPCGQVRTPGTRAFEKLARPVFMASGVAG
jgi:hypothetical protein